MKKSTLSDFSRSRNKKTERWFRLFTFFTMILFGSQGFSQVYCTLSPPSSNDATGLTNVTFNTIDNPTGTMGHYFDYSNDLSLITYVTEGSSHNLSVRVNTASTADFIYSVWVRAWIDWNKDGTFDITTEEYDLGSVTGGNDNATNLSPASITIPAGASGAYRLRVKAVYSSTVAIPHPCDTQSYSEAEDYTIFVGTPPTCVIVTGLTNTNVTFNSAGFSWNGVDNAESYNWFVFEQGANPETDTPIQNGNTTSTSVNVTTGLSPLTDYHFYVQTNCGTTDGLSDFTGISFSTECLPPAITGTTPGSACGQGEIELSATASTGASISWYSAQTEGTKLGEGETFTTPSITETTSYWVSAFTGVNGFGGRLAPASNTNTDAYDYGLVFTATNSFVLNTVDVYLAGAASNIVVRLTTNTGDVLDSRTIALPAGNSSNPVQHTLTLDFDIEPGTYRLMAQSGPYMVREAGLGGFPYAIGDVGSITGGYISGASQAYYYFYNWGYTSGCTSSRTEVVATITEAPAFEISDSVFTICNGETTDTVNITSGAEDYDTFSWSPETGVNGDAINGWTFNPTTTTAYTLTASQSTGECVISISLEVTVNPVPYLTVIPSSTEICSNADPITIITGGTQTISFGTNLQSPGTTVTFPATITEIPSGMDIVSAQLVLNNVNAINGSWRSEIRVALSGAHTMSATQISTLGSGGQVTPNPYIINLTNFTATEGTINLVLTESYDDPDVIDASFGSVELIITYGTTEDVTWSPIEGLYTDAAGTIAYTGGVLDTVYAKPTATTTYTATATTLLNCITVQEILITVEDIIPPTADSPQTLIVGQTVADILVTGENLTFYSDEELTTVVELTTVLEEGSYTFFVTQTIDNCISEAIEVVIEVTLSTNGFDMNAFKVYPNPVKDYFNVSYSKDITNVAVVNMLGQVVLKKEVNSTDTQVDMTNLPTGNYLVRVNVDGAIQTVKVVKQ